MQPSSTITVEEEDDTTCDTIEDITPGDEIPTLEGETTVQAPATSDLDDGAAARRGKAIARVHPSMGEQSHPNSESRPNSLMKRQKTMSAASVLIKRQATMGGLMKRQATTAGRRQESFVDRHGIVTALQIQGQVSRLREHLANTGQSSRSLVLNPEKNRYLGWWDVLQTLALVYTSTLTPFETCFVPPSLGVKSWRDAWFLLNRGLDVIFAIDCGLQFFVAFQIGNDYGGRQWVLSHKRIVRAYLRGWFPLDALTLVVPCAFDLYLASPSFDAISPGVGGVEGGLAERMTMLRVLRVLRLAKLVRLIRASRLVDRWKAHVPALTYATQTVLRCVLMLLLGAHWFACIIALSASLHTTVDETWVGAKLYDLCDDKELKPVLLNPPLTSCPTLGTGSWYLAALSWSVLILTGSGGTDFYPSSASDAETLVATVLVVVGSFIWTMVLAAFCDVATNSNPGLTAFRQDIDGLNLFISINALPRNMAQRLRSFMHQQKGVQLREDAKRSLPRLSPALQVEVILFIHRHWLSEIWFIKGLDAPIKVRLAMGMEPKVLAPGEVAPQRFLYVVQRGKVMFGGRILSRGMAWGDDVILTDERYFIPCQARAISYTDVARLSQETLTDIVASHPTSRHALRRSTVRLALRRSIVIRAKQERDRDFGLRRSGVGGSMGGSGRDFMDRVQEAAAGRMSDEQEVNMKIALQLNQHVSHQGRIDQRLDAMKDELVSLREEVRGKRAA